jgi:hypothetical protein
MAYYSTEHVINRKELEAIMNHGHVNQLAAQIRRFRADGERQERLREYKCKYCWYIRKRIGAAAYTTSKCWVCDKEMVFPSTATAKYCDECAKQHHACRWCGADLEG